MKNMKQEDKPEEEYQITVRIPLEKEDAAELRRRLREQELLVHINEVLANITDRMRSRKQFDGAVIPHASSIRVFRQGDFVAVLVNGDVLGISKRSKIDKFRWSEGVRKAIYRAAKRMVEVHQRRR